MRLKRMARGAAGLLLVGTLMTACSPDSEPSGDVGSGPAEGDAVSLVADDTFFEPEALELTAGETVTVEVTNEGSTVHDFAIEHLDLNTGTINSGDVATATFTVPEGTTTFKCTFHPGMEGTIEGRSSQQ
jgi:plastocyanin